MLRVMMGLLMSVCLVSCSEGGDDGGFDLSSLTAGELNDNMEIPNAVEVSGDLPAGADTGTEPQVTNVVLPDPIEFDQLFQVKVDFQTGSDALTKLFVQVSGADGYFELATSAVPNTAGSVSFPIIVKTPSEALVKAFELIIQLEGESGTAGLPTTKSLNLSDESGGTGGTGGTGGIAGAGGTGGGISCNPINPTAPAGTTTASGTYGDGLSWSGVDVVASFKETFAEGGLGGQLTLHFHTNTGSVTACGLQEAGYIMPGVPMYGLTVFEFTEGSTYPSLPSPDTYAYSSFDSKPIDEPYLSGGGIQVGWDPQDGSGSCNWGSGTLDTDPPSGSITLDSVSALEGVSGSFTYTDGFGNLSSGTFTNAPLCNTTANPYTGCCYVDGAP